MKKLTIFFTLLAPAAVFGQGEKLSLYVHGGYLSSLYVKEALLEDIRVKPDNDQHKCIILNAGFQMRVSEKWRIGPSFTYDHFGTQQRVVEFSTLGYMIKADRIWKETARYSLYSGAAAGIKTVKHFENGKLISNNTGPAYQLYLIGASLALLNFSIDANLGWGTAGLFSIGVRIPFGKSEK